MYETSSNDQTIEAYNRNLAAYLKNTPKQYNESHTPLVRWVTTALSLLPNKDARILEFGSGPGRDAKYMRSLGYNVTCSDASSEFVKYLQRSDQDALSLNVLKDPIPTGYSMFFANSVIPHFSPSNLDVVLSKAYESLPPKGIFAFSVKQGTSEAWINEKMHDKRYVKYWQPSDIQARLSHAGFRTAYLQTDIPGDIAPNHVWSLFIAVK